MFYIAFAIKKFSFCMHFLNAFWHGNKTFPESISCNEIAVLPVVFHLQYSKYKGVKICFYSCRYKNQYFSLVFHSCRLCSTRVALVAPSCCSCSTCVVPLSHSRCSRLTRFALVSLVSGTRLVN